MPFDSSLPTSAGYGMFVNNSTHFPESTAVNLRFRLTRSKVEAQTCAEVCYCLPGIGVGGVSSSGSVLKPHKKSRPKPGFLPEFQARNASRIAGQACNFRQYYLSAENNASPGSDRWIRLSRRPSKQQMRRRMI